MPQNRKLQNPAYTSNQHPNIQKIVKHKHSHGHLDVLNFGELMQSGPLPSVEFRQFS